MLRGFGLSLFIAALGLAAPASALTVGVAAGSAGLDQGFGYTGCPSCVEVYSLTAGAPVGAGSTITFSGLVGPLETVTLSMVDVSPVFSDGGDTVSFSSLSYTATVTATVSSLGFGGLVSVNQFGAATGSVTGSYSASLGGSGPIALAPDVHSLSCVVDGSGVGVCGFTFGPTSFPVDDGSETLDFQHTFNVNLPEPATWMMMLVGLLGLGYLGNRRRPS